MRQQFAGFAPPPQPCFNFVKQGWVWGVNPSSFSALFRERKELWAPQKSLEWAEPHPKFTPQHPAGSRCWGKGDTSGFGGGKSSLCLTLSCGHMGQDPSLGPQQPQRHWAMEQGQGWSCGISIPLLLPMALHPKGELATPAHPLDRGRREGPFPVKLQGN